MKFGKVVPVRHSDTTYTAKRFGVTRQAVGQACNFKTWSVRARAIRCFMVNHLNAMLL